MAEWLKATDCKSVHSRVRRFEPYSAHKDAENSFSASISSLQTTINFRKEIGWRVKAEVAQLVER